MNRLSVVTTVAAAALVVAAGAAVASPPEAAEGTFTQTGITGLQVGSAGSNTVIEQTSVGTVAGTLTGSYQDRFTVVIHPNGRFNAHGTLTCQCTLDGRSGVLEFVVTDTGQLVSPDTAVFEGRFVIRRATGDLSGLSGVLQIQGTVDIPSSLSTIIYTGHIHSQP